MRFFLRRLPIIIFGSYRMHATFFSLQIGVALVLLSIHSHQTKHKSQPFILWYLLCCSSAGLIQLSSKSACIAVLVSIGLVIPFSVLSGQKRSEIFCSIRHFVNCNISLRLSRSEALKERYFYRLERRPVRKPQQTKL